MGDHVLARDDETGETGFRPVVRTYETPGLVVFDLVVAETCGQTDTLTVTYEHPFWVQDTGWIPAGQLVPGDQLVTADGDPATVLDRGVEARATTVHNVEVEELHTYFVGDQGVWVHNTSGDCDADASGASEDRINLASEGRTTHILDGDGPGSGGHGPGRGISGKSEFPSDWSDADVMEHISDVATDPNATHTQLTGPAGATSTRAGDPVRWSAEGTRGGVDVRVIYDSSGEIITGYPTNIPRNP